MMPLPLAALATMSTIDAAHKWRSNAAHIECQSGEQGWRREAVGMRAAHGSGQNRTGSTSKRPRNQLARRTSRRNSCTSTRKRTYFDALHDHVRVEHTLWSTWLTRMVQGTWATAVAYEQRTQRCAHWEQGMGVRAAAGVGAHPPTRSP